MSETFAEFKARTERQAAARREAMVAVGDRVRDVVYGLGTGTVRGLETRGGERFALVELDDSRGGDPGEVFGYPLRAIERV